MRAMVLMGAGYTSTAVDPSANSHLTHTDGAAGAAGLLEMEGSTSSGSDPSLPNHDGRSYLSQSDASFSLARAAWTRESRQSKCTGQGYTGT
jgi:hypothetical protein